MKINFEIQTEHGLFRDAIYSSVELNTKEIEAIKTKRVNNWIAVIELPEEDKETE
jgi:hypothetical protein